VASERASVADEGLLTTLLLFPARGFSLANLHCKHCTRNSKQKAHAKRSNHAYKQLAVCASDTVARPKNTGAKEHFRRGLNIPFLEVFSDGRLHVEQ
jgi:hypothetical protein